MDKELGSVFGPLPPEPANVPFFEFDLDMDQVSKMTYGNTQTLKCGGTSKRSRDVMDAHFAELYAAKILTPAFPNVKPQPIASMAFPVPKPGVSRPPRPAFYDLPTTSLSTDQLEIRKAYEASLTLDRLVVNHQSLNEVMRIQHYPVPSVQENLQKLSAYRYFAKIDITKAYWSLGLHERCRHWTYTIAPGGHAAYWLRAPMGCSAVGGFFQWALDGVLLNERAYTAIYADDIQVGADSPEELNKRVRLILRKLLDRGFRVSAKKCQLAPSTTITYLGWVLSNGTIAPSPSTLDKLWNVKKPCDLRGKPDAKRKLLKRFLGLINYLSHYLPFSAEALRPLHDLTRTKHDDTFNWTSAANHAWDAVIARMRLIEPLSSPSYAAGSWLEVYTDASATGWGGILVERRQGDPKPYLIQCVAGSFIASQLGWATIQQEVYGVWATVKRLRPFLWNQPFVLNMDHRNLLWSSTSTNPLVQRLATDLQCYRFVMKHVDGETNNIAADWISRAPYLSADTTAPAAPAAPPSCGHAGAVNPHPSAVAPTLSNPTFSDFEPDLCSDSDSDTDSVDSFYFDEFEVHTGFSHSAENLFRDTLRSDAASAIREPLCDHPRCEQPPAVPPPPDPDVDPDPDVMSYPFFLPPVATDGRCSGYAMPVSPSALLSLPDISAPAENAPPPPPPPPSRVVPDARSTRPHRRKPRFQHPPINADDLGPIPFLDGVPESHTISAEHYHVLKAFHGGPVGHTGLAPLLAALAEAGHDWPSMRADAAHLLATCHHCQLERLTRREPFPLPYRSLHIPSSLFDTIHLDILGPFPSCLLSGSRYIMIAVDEASKFHFLGHSVDCSTAELSLFLLECFKIIGLPKTLKSDRGAAFVSRSVREFCDATGIQHEFGIAHNHQSDGTVENAAKMVNSFLRTMVHELRKYAAWTPLLCNIMLSLNSLRRKILAGASSNDLVFGRRVRPMRFLRPQALQRPGAPEPDDPPAPATLNTFLADNAALQLQLLAAADDERWNVISDHQGAFRDSDASRLDWTRIGQLVSIPQPEHESRLRPGKFDLRRRGPYEIVHCDPASNTVKLRDSRAFHQMRNPPIFPWPKRWLWPYHAATFPTDPMHREAPAEDQIPVPPRPALDSPISAVLSSRPLPEVVAHIDAAHVLNHEFLCRFPDRPHSSNRWLPYATIWSTSAFAEFIVGSNLTGHVSAAAYPAAHRQHFFALAHNRDSIPRDVAIDNPRQALDLLQDYFPLESKATAPARQISTSAKRFNFLAEAAPYSAAETHAAPPSESLLQPLATHSDTGSSANASSPLTISAANSATLELSDKSAKNISPHEPIPTALRRSSRHPSPTKPFDA